MNTITKPPWSTHCHKPYRKPPDQAQLFSPSSLWVMALSQVVGATSLVWVVALSSPVWVMGCCFLSPTWVMMGWFMVHGFWFWVGSDGFWGGICYGFWFIDGFWDGFCILDSNFVGFQLCEFCFDFFFFFFGGFLCIYRFMVVVVGCCHVGGVGCLPWWLGGWWVWWGGGWMAMVGLWVYGFRYCMCGFICGSSGFAWWFGSGTMIWWMLVYWWYCDVVVVGCLRGRGRKRNSKNK